jgi:hypothetical protein
VPSGIYLSRELSGTGYPHFGLQLPFAVPAAVPIGPAGPVASLPCAFDELESGVVE